MFYPVPNVDSAVVRINKYKYKEEINYDKLIGFVKKSFTMRRKKLSANLETNRFSKQAIEEVLVENGYLATTRAEELSIEDFKRLYWVFLDIIG
jgi:16S rRNA (adenine1518-N6/adenine1519-N6)-dimethyltransferase